MGSPQRSPARLLSDGDEAIWKRLEELGFDEDSAKRRDPTTPGSPRDLRSIPRLTCPYPLQPLPCRRCQSRSAGDDGEVSDDPPDRAGQTSDQNPVSTEANSSATPTSSSSGFLPADTNSGGWRSELPPETRIQAFERPKLNKMSDGEFCRGARETCIHIRGQECRRISIESEAAVNGHLAEGTSSISRRPRSRTTIWGARFNDFTLAAVDSLCSWQTKEGRESVDHVQKCFKITGNIIALFSGYVRMIEFTLSILRDTADRLGTSCTARHLAKALQENENLQIVLQHLKEEGIDEDATILLVSAKSYSGHAVCSIDVESWDASVTYSFGSSLGAGSGYEFADPILMDIPKTSPLSLAVDITAAAFCAATESDEATGGICLIFVARPHTSWKFHLGYYLPETVYTY